MNERTNAHLVAWLRDGNELTSEVRVQLADRLAELDALWRMANYPDRPPCPTCGGKGEVDHVLEDGDAYVTIPCPGCVDGKVSIEQLVATYNAVWDEANVRRGCNCIDHLRSVKP